MSKVVVLPAKFIRGWTGSPDEQPATFPVLDAREALGDDWETDAHFVPYYIGDLDAVPRLNQSALKAIRASGQEVLFDLLVIDVDCKEAHDSEQPAPLAWRKSQLSLLRKLPWWNNAGFYETRGGYRLLWELPETMKPEQYIEYLQGFVKELAKKGIFADELSDWNRLYRLPKVIRDGERQHDRRLDLDDLGVLDWEPTESNSQFKDIETARAPLVVPDKVEPGNRNNLLARLAGKYRRMGMNQEEIYAALQVINESRCDPPVDADELMDIAKSMCRYTPPETAQGEDLGGPMFQLGSDTEIADVTCAKIEDPDGPPLVFDRSELWQYKKDLGIWEILPQEYIRTVIDTFDGEKIAAGKDRNGDPKTVPLKVGHRLCLNVANRISDRRYHKGFFDTAKDGLNFNNCFVYANAEGLHTEQFSPGHRATSRLEFEFSYGLKPARFLKTLRSCFQDDRDEADKIELLREFIGLCLLGCATKLQKGLILLGSGANGKSTIQQVIAALFTDKLTSAIPPQDMSQEYRRAMLSTSRLNVVNELPEADILASESVKAMISGDLMVGRHIKQSPFEFVPKAGHIFSANALPGVRDMSLGFWRRWLVLPFNKTFRKHEQIPGLANSIIDTELQAVASWALEGAADALRDGYTIPTSSRQAIDTWRTEADQVAAFLQYLQERELEEKEPASKIYNEYCLWASNSGHRHLSAVKFSKRLGQLGVEKTRTKMGNFYIFHRNFISVDQLH